MGYFDRWFMCIPAAVPRYSETTEMVQVSAKDGYLSAMVLLTYTVHGRYNVSLI